MNIESLNKRITIQKFTLTINENGFEEEDWVDYKTIWSAVSNLFGREYFSAMAVQAEKTIKFTIRYTKDIDESMRIVFQNKIYNITFIDNVKYDNIYLEIKAIEVV